MQRKAVRRTLPGIAMLTALVAGAAGLTGCTSGSGKGSTSDSKAGGSSAAPAQPGKYRILPAPCKAGADSKRLKAMLPAADSLTPNSATSSTAGTADASYDGDRRVGCRWTAQTPEETRLLSVGFERVVSYDRAVASDDDKARQVYVRQLTDAHLPFPGPSLNPTCGREYARRSPGGHRTRHGALRRSLRRSRLRIALMRPEARPPRPPSSVPAYWRASGPRPSSTTS